MDQVQLLVPHYLEYVTVSTDEKIRGVNSNLIANSGRVTPRVSADMGDPDVYALAQETLVKWKFCPQFRSIDIAVNGP
jgi:hypothetical protein